MGRRCAELGSFANPPGLRILECWWSCHCWWCGEMAGQACYPWVCWIGRVRVTQRLQVARLRIFLGKNVALTRLPPHSSSRLCSLHGAPIALITIPGYSGHLQPWCGKLIIRDGMPTCNPNLMLNRGDHRCIRSVSIMHTFCWSS